MELEKDPKDYFRLVIFAVFICITYDNNVLSLVNF